MRANARCEEAESERRMQPKSVEHVERGVWFWVAYIEFKFNSASFGGLLRSEYNINTNMTQELQNFQKLNDLQLLVDVKKNCT